ncbi:hypothetical protein [Flavobacterium sp. UBA7680]|uniref:hypothetical protein n=1 Tax=Flavobacterium sp. UBA7680 TaxID=1946559 RepID=UPI0025B85848|nr:hypothetical protein [Flavobacterium sp. UBA7680]
MKISLTMLCISLSVLLFNCNKAANSETSDAQYNLNKANRDLQQASKDSRHDAKEKTITEWKAFNEKSEKVVSVLNDQLKEFQRKINTAGQKDDTGLKKEIIRNREKLKAMRTKLRERNMEFENGMLKLDDSLAFKNESFQREFDYDMDQLDKAFKDLFKNNLN